MTEEQEFSQLPADFAGEVRLFPLPNLVMFPHVIQPFHIFEPRYREMLEDALQGDHLIAMSTLDAGWENQYHAQPAIAPTVCIGRVVNYAAVDDGKYNILLLGIRRARIVEEFPLGRSFRQARVEVLEDLFETPSASRRAGLRNQLMERFQSFIPKYPSVQKQMEQLLSQDIPLGVLTDLVAHTLSLEQPFKLDLLGENRIDYRASMLVSYFDELLAEDAEEMAAMPPFPPQFSAN